LKAVPTGFSSFRLTLLFGFVWSASVSLVPESEVWEVLSSTYVWRLHVGIWLYMSTGICLSRFELCAFHLGIWLQTMSSLQANSRQLGESLSLRLICFVNFVLICIAFRLFPIVFH
jgi:hypothetical protein